ncbi:MAG TPA: lysoplasmalogenase [Longimicrobium sp.]|nr:lysoplasmalogenase [Longimicrobium sp.]
MAALPLALTLLAAASAALAVWAEHRGARRALYVFKPLATVLVLALAAAAPQPVSRGYQALVCAGLLFSLAGDVFLMLPRDRFVPGLASFLFAHLFYVAAFAPRPVRLAAPLALAALLAYGIVLMRAIWSRLGDLRAPVAVYAAALLVMAWQAAERWALLGTMPALLAAAGAGLFVISDSVLAWERFRGKVAHGPAVVLGTYFAAQWLIASSVSTTRFG